jgi:hypothetical protein
MTTTLPLSTTRGRRGCQMLGVLRCCLLRSEHMVHPEAVFRIWVRRSVCAIISSLQS